MATTDLNINQSLNLNGKKDCDVLEAKANYEKAIKIGEQMPKDKPENLIDLARAYYNLAVLQTKHLGDYKSAKSNFEKAVEIGKQLPKDNPEYQHTLAQAYYRYAVLLAPEEYETTKTIINSPINILINQEQGESHGPYIVVFASTYYNHLAKHTKGNSENPNNFDGSLQDEINAVKDNYEKAIEICKQLPRDNTEYQSTLARAYYRYAVLFVGSEEYETGTKEYEAAEANVKSAIAIFKHLTDSNPEFLIDLLKCNCTLADTYVLRSNIYRSKLKEAKETLDGIKTQAETYLSDNPNDRYAQEVNKYIKTQLDYIIEEQLKRPKSLILLAIVIIVAIAVIAAIIWACIM